MPEQPNTAVNNFDQIDANEVEGVLDSVDIVVTETKKGYRTTEFWATVVGSLAVAFNGIPAPESKEGYIIAALLGLYAVSRGLAKKGIPHVETTPSA